MASSFRFHVRRVSLDLMDEHDCPKRVPEGDKAAYNVRNALRVIKEQNMSREGTFLFSIVKPLLNGGPRSSDLATVLV